MGSILLPKVGCAIKTTDHETTNAGSFFINFGREYVGSGDNYRTLPTGREGEEKHESL